MHVAGDLDIATTAQLERTLREAAQQTRLVLLDLRELAFMDCAGVHAIVDAGIRARQLGHRLVLLRGAPSVDRLFALTGTTGVDDHQPAAAKPVAGDVARLVVESAALIRHGSVDFAVGVADVDADGAAPVLEAVRDQFGDHELEVRDRGAADHARERAREPRRAPSGA